MDLSQSRHKSNIRTFALFASIALILPLLYFSLPALGDWREVYRPAALAVSRDESPYLERFYNPPWILLPLIPVALLPERLGDTLFLLLILGSILYPLLILRASPVAAVLFLSSPPVVAVLWNGNIDSFSLLGVFAPPPVALLLAIGKPQAGIGIAIFILTDVWRKAGLLGLLRVLIPLGILSTLSFAVYGFPDIGDLSESSWNSSIFPYTVPAGIVLLWDGLRRREILPAAAASPFFAPYFNYCSLIGAFALLLDRPKTLFFAWILLWIPSIVKGIL